MNNIILYHANCPDGFGAALAAWLRYGDTHTRYFPVSYDHPVPDWHPTDPPGLTEPADIIILDFSYPADELHALADRDDVATVTVIDHHATAAAQLAGIGDDFDTFPNKLRAQFDMNHSGAWLAYRFFNPTVHPDDIPGLFHYIQDRDLWRFRLHTSREVHAGLWCGTLPRTFHAWAQIIREWETPNGYLRLKLAGREILASEHHHLTRLARNAEHVFDAQNRLVLRVNSPVLQSELGDFLLTAHPLAEYADIYWDTPTGRAHSLRARNGGPIDVGAIAATHGGGGHKAAAGYREPSTNQPTHTP